MFQVVLATGEDIAYRLNAQMKPVSSFGDPSLAALQAFVSVARHGSFRCAAVERGVSASAFSHVIRGLEDMLGVRLFHRTSRSVRLTQVGRELLERLGPALGEVAEALGSARASSTRPSGLLRLNIPAAMVSPGERTGRYRVGGDQLLTDERGESRISVEDLAVAVLDEAEIGTHRRARISIAY